MYRKGDIVKIWSLQSFYGSGFLEGIEGIVVQNQIGKSVIVAVKRIIDGEDQIDPSYEVYENQLEFVSKSKEINIIKKFENLIDEIKKT